MFAILYALGMIVVDIFKSPSRLALRALAERTYLVTS